MIMDMGNGNLKQMNDIEIKKELKKNPRAKQRFFQIGEIVYIKSYRFKIIKITPKKLTLRILPNEKT